MKKIALFLFVTIMVSGCNSVYLKPNSLDSSETFFADRGGYTMRRAIKQRMTQRGYNIVVGRALNATDMDDSVGESIEIDSDRIPNDARYRIKVHERREIFRPVWCAANGFWWWHFNVSIADQLTGEELMTWRGHGCASSSLRKLEAILDKMERTNANTKEPER